MHPQVQPQLLWDGSGALDVSLSPLNALQLTPPDAMLPTTMPHILDTMPMPDLTSMPLPTSGFVSGGSTPTSATTLTNESLRQHGELILANSMAVTQINTTMGKMSDRLLQVDESLAKLLKLNEEIEKRRSAELRAISDAKNQAPRLPRPSHPNRSTPQSTPNMKPDIAKTSSAKKPANSATSSFKKPLSKMPNSKKPSTMKPYKHAPALDSDSDEDSDVSIRITGMKRPASRKPPNAPKKRGKGPTLGGKSTAKPRIKDFDSPPPQRQTQIPRKRPAPPMPSMRSSKRPRISRRRQGIEIFGHSAYNPDQLATVLTSTSAEDAETICTKIRRAMKIIKDMIYMYRHGISREGQREILRDIRKLAPPGLEMYWNRKAADGLASAMAGAIQSISRSRRCAMKERHSMLVGELRHAWPYREEMLTDTRTCRQFEEHIWALMDHIDKAAAVHESSLKRRLDM